MIILAESAFLTNASKWFYLLLLFAFEYSANDACRKIFVNGKIKVYEQ